MTDEVTTKKGMRVRSPSFPGATLESCIERTKIIYDAAARFPLPILDVIKKIGFANPNSGNAQVVYSALKKYGLVDDTGTGNNRLVKVTDLAVYVLVVNPNQDDSIQRAALMPTMMSDWWKKYGTTLPPMETLNYEYVAKGKFTVAGLNEFVRIYKSNIEFAKLSPSTTINTSESIPVENNSSVDRSSGGIDGVDRTGNDPQRRSHIRKETMSYAIPVALGEDIIIDGAFPLTEEKWARLQTILAAMKPSLVNDEDAGE